jgi:predicted TIM-barrel enzyme
MTSVSNVVQRHDIHVFLPVLDMTLYAHTYRGFASAEAAKAHFVRVNDHHDAGHVTVTEREWVAASRHPRALG